MSVGWIDVFHQDGGRRSCYDTTQEALEAMQRRARQDAILLEVGDVSGGSTGEGGALTISRL